MRGCMGVLRVMEQSKEILEGLVMHSLVYIVKGEAATAVTGARSWLAAKKRHWAVALRH